jgi:hypothetical protein
MSVQGIEVVLSSSWVAQHGYRTVLALLPSVLGSKIVGATAPGNRVLGPSLRRDATSRRILLERDYLRREPNEVLVLECDARCVPTRLREQTLIVEEGLWRARDTTWIDIAHRLKALISQGVEP